MLIEMQLHGYPNKHGVLEDLPFGDVKKRFRAHLDEVFDHHLLLNENDPWAHPLAPIGAPIADYRMLPGLVVMPNDPTTENLARWIAEWSINEFNLHVEVTVDETGTNSAGYMMAPRIGD
jgi:6-pyruvoyl-tetrahydropterin synthase